LFGIPRSQRSAGASSTSSPAPSGTGAPASAPSSRQPGAPTLQTNTNLEDMSDWLTKLLVGVGLTQLQKVSPTLRGFGDYVGGVVGLGGAVGLFAQGIVVYFSVLGFLSGYLVTRLFLAGAFSEADRQLDALREELKAEKDRTQGAQQSAENLKLLVEAPAATQVDQRGVDASTPRSLLDAGAARYNEIRQTEDSGPDRTRHMTEVWRQMLDVAARLQDFDAEQQLDSPDRGKRLAAYAWVYMHPRPDLLDPLLRSLEKYSAARRSETDNRPFGEYWGILTLDKVLDQQRPSRETLERLRRFGQTVDRGTDRSAEITRILHRFGMDV